MDTKNNIADVFTKYVTPTVLEKLRPAILGEEYPPEIITKSSQGKVNGVIFPRLEDIPEDSLYEIIKNE